MLAFIVWMSFTSLFALQPPDVVYASWSQVIKTQLMLFVSMMLIRGRKQIDQLIWAIVISVGYFGVKGYGPSRAAARTRSGVLPVPSSKVTMNWVWLSRC
jgi:hypothetical protein